MGFASGFQVGASAVERGLKMREEDALRRELAQAAGRFDVTEGAAGPGLQGNIEQVRGLQDQAIAAGMAPEEAIKQYGPSIAELERMQGLKTPEYFVGGGGRAYQTRAEAGQAAAPERAQALGDVYRRYGDVGRAEELQQQAMTGMRAGLEVNELRRREQERLRAQEADQEVAEYAKSLAGEDGKVLDNRGMLQVAQRRANAYTVRGLADAAGKATQEYFSVAKSVFDENDRTLKTDLAKTLASSSPQDYAKFYDKYVLDGAKVSNVTQDPKTGAITVSRVTDDGKPLPSMVLRGGIDELRATVSTFADPAALRQYSENSFRQNMDVLKFEETKRHARVTEGQGQQRINLESQGPLARTITTLKNAGIDVSQDDIRVLAGLNKEDNALLKAQVDAVLKGVDPLQPKTVDTARAQIQGLFTQAAAAKQQAQVQAAAKRASKDGKLPEFVQELRSRDVADDVIAAQLRAAGVPVPPELIPPPEPAPATMQQGPSFMQRLFPGGGSYQPTPAVGLSR